MSIVIHYCAAWGYKPEVLRVKAWFESRGRGPVDIQVGKSGQFDIVVDGRLAYSKYKTGRIPADADLERIAAPW